ncbi:MAG: hypothetical protein JWN17_2315 [Frankiales bacterium]|nr:hypothetical protein [Frankiales bacterium]
MSAVAGGLLGLLLGGLVVALGVHGYRNAEWLARGSGDVERYDERVDVLRRGSVACAVVGAVLVLGPWVPVVARVAG